MPSAPITCASRFHRHVTTARVAAVVAVLTVLTVAITLPIVIDRADSAAARHRDDAKRHAEAAIGDLDRQFQRFVGATARLKGFVLAAAPLSAPSDYFAMTAEERLATAMNTTRPGVLSNSAFQRVHRGVAASFAGYRMAAVQPGLVNAFIDSKLARLVGQDWLRRSPQAELEWDFIVRRGRVFTRPVGFAITDASVPIVVVRLPLWSNEAAVVLDKHDLTDPATGRHPNWNFLWGAVSIVMDIRAAVSAIDAFNGIPTSTAAHEFAYDWVLTSAAQVVNGEAFPDVMIANSSLPNTASAGLKEPISMCSDALPSVCLQIAPRAGSMWTGADRTGELILAAVLALLLPGALVALVVAVARLVVGPEPEPLRFAPYRVPFHAVVLDIPEVPRLWTEVPFVMHEVTTNFADAIERIALEHKVFVAIRHGTTAVVAAQTRSRLVSFTLAFAEHAATFVWPAHISVHCSQNTLLPSAVMHTCKQATIYTDVAAGVCEIDGLDMQALLLLRSVGIAGHVVCTGEFLALKPLLESMSGAGNDDFANILGHDGSNSNEDDEGCPNSESGVTPQDVMGLVGEVGELGVCEVALPSEVLPVTPFRGFLLHSELTRERDLNDVLDSFPDAVWAEWRSAQVLVDAGLLDAGKALNPLSGAAPGDATGRASSLDPSAWRSSIAFSMTGRAASVSATRAASITGARRQVTRAHLNNGPADSRLPASAVDFEDLDKLASTLVRFLSPRDWRDPDAGSNKPQRVPQGGGAIAAGGESLAVGPGHVGSGERERHLRAAVSLSTYFMAIFRLMFTPLDADARRAMVSRICAAVGVAADDYATQLAVRCVRQSLQFVFAGAGGDGLAQLPSQHGTAAAS